MTSKQTPAWLDAFPALHAIDSPEWLTLVQSITPEQYPAKHLLYNDGQSCDHYLLLVSGGIRVEKLANSGHEITLYHIKPGNGCELTTTCLLSDRPYHANAITEAESVIALIPKNDFHALLDNTPPFKTFVYQYLDKGISELVQLIEDVAFGAVDQRLAHFLIGKSHNKNIDIHITHYAIAVELGTAREVISRLLKEFERHQWLTLHRGWIQIHDIDGLRALTKK